MVSLDVDEYPDTGYFSWTGVRGGEWKCQYHVIFFDGIGQGWSMSTEQGLIAGQEVREDGGEVQQQKIVSCVWRWKVKQRRMNHCLVAWEMFGSF